MNKLIPQKPVVTVEKDLIKINSDFKVELDYKIELNNREILKSDRFIYDIPVDISEKYLSGSKLEINLYVTGLNGCSRYERLIFL